MTRTEGSVSLNSAEAEYYGMVSALVEAKQVQEMLGEYHEDTHSHEMDSSAAEAIAERLVCGRMKHISVKYRYPAGCHHEPRRMVAKSRYEEECSRRFVSQQVLTNMLTALKI